MLQKEVIWSSILATSDGAMNIVPHAYSSSGQKFPAQVKFSILWSCNPIFEDRFQSAIKDNYFSAKKFNFGLSRMQVHRLLSLFSLTKFSDQLHTRQLSSDPFECSSDYLICESQSVADGNGPILNERLQGKLMEGEDQVNSMQESAPLSHYNIRNIIPTKESAVYCPYMVTRNPTCSSGCLGGAQITTPSLHSQSDCMNSMALQSSVYFENIIVPSITQSQINVSCSNPNLLPLPIREFEHDGSLRRSIVTSEYPSNGLNDSFFSYQNEQGLTRQENMEIYVPVTKEFPSQLPFDSVVVSSMPSIEHTAANHGQECYGSSKSIYSDHERKGNVFSRLSYPSDASLQEYNGCNHEMLFLDPSVLEVSGQWKKTDHEVPRPKPNAGRNFVKKKCTKSLLSSYSNCFQVSDEHGAINEDSIGGNSDHSAIEIPFVNFKRRRKHLKVEHCTPTGGELSGLQQKRKKLIRPSFACSELHDSGDTNIVSPSLCGPSFACSELDESGDTNSIFTSSGGMSMVRVLRGKSNINHINETDKAEKLYPAVELPDTIWLVDDDEKNIDIETVATAENCCELNKISEDKIASSNYISNSDLNITSKDLIVKESCKSTHNCSTSENHMKFQNLNNSGLCRQELSLESSEVNTGNSFIRFNEGGNRCNAKELILSVKIAEPFHGPVAVIESSVKSSSPLNSDSESASEDVIERRKENNENEES
ncbi:uncharacterized protein LOC105436360 isoform X2 [Cucumis sativus]|uniref:uncharacterized protein LOC105436360 isoform X2 n=1 Tax=Cucumis sativus TaxID=3659 RepID=UPI0005ECE697|nr:uncharacterized protein LOC105436360 isoform X2 [Cucumis sativus]XP_031736285.1 uncharacterized protein LOC105436360 isoform X2 [Cucumis sativus]KAE8653662.1 hypothetical protein Csa_007556 [Cucumis sativus]